MLLCFLYYFLSFPCVIQKLVFQHHDVMSQILINIHGLIFIRKCDGSRFDPAKNEYTAKQHFC